MDEHWLELAVWTQWLEELEPADLLELAAWERREIWPTCWADELSKVAVLSVAGTSYVVSAETGELLAVSS